MRHFVLLVALCSLLGCRSSDDPPSGDDRDAQQQGDPRAGSFVALTYNVAGLPEGLSQSMPEQYTPLIGPKLNDYDLVFLQETWQTPADNPFESLRGYHEILVASSKHPYKTPPAEQPFGKDERRPSAQLGDGLNIFSRFELADTTRVAWETCVDSASDCLALKGFSMTPAKLADGALVHLYDLHMEAGSTPEDDTARAGDIEQLVAFIAEHSQDTALLIGGDFNLATENDPSAGQYARLREQTGLIDACESLDCDVPGSIDKILFRSSDQLSLRADSWQREDAVFQTDSGEMLSDHHPVAVRVSWSVTASN